MSEGAIWAENDELSYTGGKQEGILCGGPQGGWRCKQVQIKVGVKSNRIEIEMNRLKQSASV